jgi:hypothetical protein
MFKNESLMKDKIQLQTDLDLFSQISEQGRGRLCDLEKENQNLVDCNFELTQTVKSFYPHLKDQTPKSIELKENLIMKK